MTLQPPEGSMAVIIATRNRSQSLHAAISSLKPQFRATGAQLVAIDNGSSDDTHRLLRELSTEVDIVALAEPIAGKSRALNRALDSVRAEILVFTDDDVLPDPDWLESLRELALRHPHARIICGPITPKFPPGTPQWLMEHWIAPLAFAHFGPVTDSEILPASSVPFGPNFAVRASAIGEARFRLDLGPSDLGPFLCEDIDFIERLQNNHNYIAYSRDAGVYHCIRPELIDLSFLSERAFWFGRSIVRKGLSEPLLVETGNFIQEATCDEIYNFESSVLFSFYIGELMEWRIQAGGTSLALEEALANCALPRHFAYMPRAALDWVAHRPEGPAFAFNDRLKAFSRECVSV
jgi:glycosyltransferase involved in cell wall biosynthesis